MTSPTHDDTWPTLGGELILEALVEPGPVGSGRTRVSDWAARSDAGLARDHNEDRWGQHRDWRFLLADGMGGHANGGRAAAIVRDGAVEATTEPWVTLIRRLNAQVRQSLRSDGPPAGTTLVALDIQATRATVVSVGDSRIYRCRSGRLEQLTADHTLRGDLMSVGIDADRHADARESRGLTSYLGIEAARLRVDVVDVPVAGGDRFLLCSDGIHEVVHAQVMAASLALPSCDDVIEDLFQARKAARGRDDATAIVVDIT